MSKFESSSHGSTLSFSSHDFFYLTWICVVLFSNHVVSLLGHVSKCKRYCRNFVMLEKFLPLDLCLDTMPCSFKVLCLLFPSSHHTLGGIMLHLNLITIMLWDRYPLVCSNPSNFSLEKWRKILSPCIFSLFWAGNAPISLKKSVTQVSNAPYTWERSGVTVSSLIARSVTP